VAYLVASLTKETPKEIRDLVESVRVPRGAAGAQAGH
jgi:cation/acetate symporter